jgi:hypothetical protein
MPQMQVTRTTTITKVVPAYRPELATQRRVNLGPSLTLAAGTVLGQITNAADDVQTISDTGTVSGGTFTVSGTNPITGASFTTAAVAYNVSNANLKAALEAVLGHGITATVAGSGLPGNDTTITFGGSADSLVVPLMTIDSSSLTGTNPVLAIAKTTVGRTKVTGKAYATGNSDGSEVARWILPYAVTTDTAGMISMSNLSGEVAAPAEESIDVWVSGYFRTADLTGLDADAIPELGRMVEGDITNGGIIAVGL